METSRRERSVYIVARVPRRGDGPGPAPGCASGGVTRRRSAAYQDAYLDGLFTYCLSIMCEHDQATSALGEALALAERRHRLGRRPADAALHRPWLYALARWACLRRLAARQQRERRPAAPGVPRAVRDGEDAPHRRRELAALAWAEAAGTTPEQREALELAVRHQLPVREIARVLRLSEVTTRTRLTAAACEVERTRGALAAVRSSGCPAVAALSGEDRLLLLGPQLRRELVRHVDECPSCRLVAQQAMASAGWPGSSGTAVPTVVPAAVPTASGSPAASRLPVLTAPRDAVHAARQAAHEARAQPAPRFDRGGFPLSERDRLARRERLRARAVTTTVAATVLAAPVLALWAAYRGAPLAGELSGQGGRHDAANSRQDEGGPEPYGTGSHLDTMERGGSQEGAGGAGDARREREGAPGDAERGGGMPGGAGEPADLGTAAQGRAGEDAGGSAGAGHGGGPEQGAGRLTAVAETTSTGARITLTASGGAPVAWTASWAVDWLLLSQDAGTLRPGETAVIEVTVVVEREPPGPWRARIAIDPAAVITVEGSGERPTSPPPSEEPEPPATSPPPGTPGPSPDGSVGPSPVGPTTAGPS